MSATPVTILLVDDEPGVRRALARVCAGASHVVREAGSVEEARACMGTHGAPDVVLLDVGLPDGSGLEFARDLVGDEPGIGVVIVSGSHDPAVGHAAVDVGAYGYVGKPFTRDAVLIAVHNAVRRRDLELARTRHTRELERAVEERTEQLHRAYATTVDRLIRAVEFRDTETAGHVSRMSRYCETLASRLGSDPETMRVASTMHDLGKIGIPDAILLKPGPMDPAERAVMERHTIIGHDLLSGSESPLIRLAALIALTHHERWDGGGYPHGRRGREIPLAGRIAAVADVFDALTSPRVYRPDVMTDSEALDYLWAGRGTQFDPDVVDAMLQVSLDDLRALRAPPLLVN